MKVFLTFMVIAISLAFNKPIFVLGQNTTENSTDQIPGERLRIAVPLREFTQFVKIKHDARTGEYNFSGFSVEVFKAVADEAIPSVSYDLVPFVKADGTLNGTFDDMLKAVFNKEYDGAVGEITILYYRTQWVDFTVPYIDKEVSMLIPAQFSKTATFSPAAQTTLAVTLLFAMGIFIAACIWCYPIITVQGNVQDNIAEKKTEVGIVLVPMVFLLITAHFMPHQTSSLQPLRHDGSIEEHLNQLIRTEARVGYRQGGFVKNVLMSKGLSETQLIELDSEEEMLDKLQRGSDNGGIDAVISGAHFLKLFQAKDCRAFALVPSFSLHSGGLGFAFQKGSPLVKDLSAGILKLIDNGELAKIQDRTIGNLDTCDNENLTDGSSTQDLLYLWLPIASSVFVIILGIFMSFFWYRFRRNQRRQRDNGHDSQNNDNPQEGNDGERRDNHNS